MATISLAEFAYSNSIVVHFGGRSSEIEAYTFAASLIGFDDTARAV
jgi:hypothetical protein